jgi:hypothetical protein
MTLAKTLVTNLIKNHVAIVQDIADSETDIAKSDFHGAGVAMGDVLVLTLGSVSSYENE